MLVLILSLLPAWSISLDCIQQVRKYYGNRQCDEKGRNNFEAFSVGILENKKWILPHAWKMSREDFFVAGTNNLLMIYGKGNPEFVAKIYQRLQRMNIPAIDPDNNPVGVLTGDNTKLEEVGAVAIDPYNDEIMVYDKKSNRIFSYPGSIAGNLLPYRILSDDRLEGTVDIAIDGIKEKLYVLNQAREEILIYSQKANIHGRKGKKKLEPLQIIKEVPYEIQSLGIAPNYGEIYFLGRFKITVHSLKHIDFQSPLRTIEVPTKEEGSASLSYLHDRDQLLIYSN